MQTFGELLKRLRGARQQRDVAAELRMPVTTLSTLENQTKLPRAAVLKRLADYYGVPITYFYPVEPPALTCSGAAKQWLSSLRAQIEAKDTVAMHASIDFPDEVKREVEKLIRTRKNAEVSGS